jgi:glycolate oxidase iron-sulfur subunit
MATLSAGAPRAGAFAGADAPDLDALRACVHCGICLPQCPTYRVLGEEMDSPRGRLYLVRAAAEGRLPLTDTLARHLDLCLGCRACETACPSGVPFGSILEAARAQVARRRRPSVLERLVYGLFPEPGRLGVLLRALRVYQRTGLRRLVRATGLLALAPRLAAMETLLPEVPRPAPLPGRVPAAGRPRGRVGLLAGCVQRCLFPDVNLDTARLLSLAGWDVVVPGGQGCCGALDLHAGRLDVFRARARRLVAAFPPDLDWIVVNAAGCGSAMKEYGRWLPGEPAAATFAGRVRDVSEVLGDAELPLGPLETTATYHDACHLAHGQRVRSEPRALLARVPGLRLVPLQDSDLCCGSAGVYSLLEPGVADRVLAMKIDRIAGTGARVVVTGNPGCILQIARGCRARGLDVEVLHPVQVLARSVARGAGQGTRP